MPSLRASLLEYVFMCLCYMVDGRVIKLKLNYCYIFFIEKSESKKTIQIVFFFDSIKKKEKKEGKGEFQVQ